MSTAEDRVINPFAGAPVVAAPTGASAAAMAQREIAEIQAAMIIAKKFPRDPIVSMDRILNACARVSLAEEATYTFARGGQNISGPSIRLAEQLARDWGNIQAGVIELSRANGVSEVMTYAWDLETNFKDEKRFQIKHWRDTREGGYAIKDERDIYELLANQAARRKRACILAIIPGDVQEAAVRQCEITLKSSGEVTPEKIKAMIEGFATYSVTKEMIEKKIQRRIDAIEPAQVVQLRRIFTSLKDGMGVASDYFEVEPADADAPPAKKGTEGVKDKIKAKQANKPTAAAASPETAEKSDDAIPHYDEASAVKAIKESGDLKALEEAWSDILLDFDATNREVPPSVDEAYKAQKMLLAGK
jgi:hypothetical protein